MNQMIRRKIPPYTFPFVLSTWIAIILIKYFNLIPLRLYETNLASHIDLVSSLTMGFGQVMFQTSIVVGAIFFIAIIVNSKKSAFYGLLGSLVGTLIALVISAPLALINIGIFGFNGVLCGIAFANKKYAFMGALVSIIISVFILYGMVSLNIIALTSPFVFSTWVTLFLMNKIRQSFSL